MPKREQKHNTDVRRLQPELVFYMHQERKLQLRNLDIIIKSSF